MIHKSSYVDGAMIGRGTSVWHFCHISLDASIGQDCTIGQNCFVGENVKIGDRVKIQNNVSVYEGVTIEDDVFIGPSVVFTNVKAPHSDVTGKRLPTLVKKGATIGANATIICGVTIGRLAFVGAGAVVTKDVGDGVCVVGVPARDIKTREVK